MATFEIRPVPVKVPHVAVITFTHAELKTLCLFANMPTLLLNTLRDARDALSEVKQTTGY